MTDKQTAVSLVKRFQEANPTIRKTKEEAIASAIVASEIVIEVLSECECEQAEFKIMTWESIKEYLYNL